MNDPFPISTVPALPESNLAPPPTAPYRSDGMKTTLDLPPDLLDDAQTVAAQCHITLQTLVENSIRREIASLMQLISLETPGSGQEHFVGLPRRGVQVSPETVRQIQEKIDEEDLKRSIQPQN